MRDNRRRDPIAMEVPMSVVEDVRKEIQDILAPDIKAIDARLTALNAAIKEGFSAEERVAAARHELILSELGTAKVIADSRHEAILKALDIEQHEFGFRKVPYVLEQARRL
jgi:hypothetical protein